MTALALIAAFSTGSAVYLGVNGEDLKAAVFAASAVFQALTVIRMIVNEARS